MSQGVRLLARSRVLGWVCVALASMVLSAVDAESAWAARKWRKVGIQNARCGDGLPYSVFVSRGDPRKIAFDLMGGGACWDAATCYALPDTWVHPIPTVLERGGFVSDDPAESPVAGHTMVYFPYCTADVHVGGHVAHYLPATPFYHMGANNISTAVAQLVAQGEIDLAQADQFVMTGFSAGALGALFHSMHVAPYVRNVPDKVLIADSPGLHFGAKFWDKFTRDLFRDFAVALGKVGMRASSGEGNIAGLVPRACAELKDWRVGILQGSRDLVMSRVFGAISPSEHEKLVYGPSGVFKATEDPSDNCSAWVPETAMHTFLVTSRTATLRTSDGVSANDYVRNLVQGVWGGRGRQYVAGPNHR